MFYNVLHNVATTDPYETTTTEVSTPVPVVPGNDSERAWIQLRFTGITNCTEWTVSDLLYIVSYYNGYS